MKKKDKLIYLIAFLTLISIIASFFIDLKIILSISFLILLMASYVIYKEKIGQELVVALLIALIITSYYLYKYTTSNIMIGRINLFPLVSWTFGLVLLREIYEKQKIKYKFIISSLIYLIGLFIVEYVGYYLLNIKLNSNFESLFGLGIIHAPVAMKLFYLFAGPIYLLITDYLKVK